MYTMPVPVAEVKRYGELVLAQDASWQPVGFLAVGTDFSEHTPMVERRVH